MKKLKYFAKKMFVIFAKKTYLKMIYKRRMKNKLDFKNPKTFNGKLQWLKIYDRNPEYTKMVDKYEVKNHVAEEIGGQHIIPTLGVWDDVDDIDFDVLPDKFVLKCTHDSGGVVICKDKSSFDVAEAKRMLSKSLKTNYYYFFCEWPYKNVKPRIIAEKYMTDSAENDSFTDYKFFCFGGEVDCVMLCIDRFTDDKKFYFFDREWNLKRYNKRGKAAPEGFTVPKPPRIDEMFEFAQKLSKDYPFVRIDLYNSDGEIYFGEFTLYPDSGFDANVLPETDIYFGEKIKIKA